MNGVEATVKILDSGPADELWNLVIVAEGYRESEMLDFAIDAQSFVTQLLSTPPFGELRCAINVYRIDVVSQESGADDPSTGTTANTYFDATYGSGGLQRLLSVNTQLVAQVVFGNVPEAHEILVIVNSTVAGGSGGTVAVTARHSGWEQTAIHELGHSAFDLADEYPYLAGCGIDQDQDYYPANQGEPAHPNVTINTNRDSIKWGYLVDQSTPLPTANNPDCTQCNYQVLPQWWNVVGAFEGGHHYHCGVYRPQASCKMGGPVSLPFCEVCHQHIRQTLAHFIPDGYAPVFPPSSTLECAFFTIIAILELFRLSTEPDTPERQNRIRVLRFYIRNCGRGNSVYCIPLAE